jgi:transposase
LVSETNRKKRLVWCQSRKNWNDEWNFIIWSDESRFELFQNDSHNWVWRKPKEKYDVDCLTPTVKHGKDGVMMWGCFVNKKLGPLVEVNGSINSFKYTEILKYNLIPFLESLDDTICYSFQDDNASSHKSNETMEWKEDNLLSCLPWPAQSPDLNPIEHLWDVLERKVRLRKPHPKNKKELVNVLQEEWNKIEPKVLENLIESMPRRIKAVIEANGYSTRY